MIASRLLGYYPQISDTPDAVQRMRQLILNLAVRGRLVPQDPDDEPASKLSDRISAERARLVKAGEIKAPPPRSQTEKAALPFELPSGWALVRLGQAIELGCVDISLLRVIPGK